MTLKPPRHACFLPLSLIIAIVVHIQPLQAATIEVPGDAATIRAAVDLAVNGDEVVLVAALYSGEGNHTVSIIDKAITIRSQSLNPESCVIDAAGNLGFVFLEGSSASALMGVTVSNARAVDGGAVSIRNIYTLVSQCVFSGNAASGKGGAIYIRNSMSDILDCVFEANTADGGGAISCTRTTTSLSPTIRNCVFRDNTADFAGGIEARNRCAPTIEYCTFTNNVANGAGGAVGGENAPFTLRFCTLSGNRSGIFGGAGIAGSFPSGTLVENTLIVNSVAGSAVYNWDDNFITFSCCNIFGNAGGDWIDAIAGQYPGGGNLAVDPQFCSTTPDTDEYWALQADSPCTPDESNCGLIGAWGTDCGTTATELMGWGNVKALFR